MNLQDLESTDWFRSLLKEVEEELARLHHDRHDRRPALENERKELERQIQGWALSLANPELDSSVRGILETHLQQAQARKQEIDISVTQQEAERQAVKAAIAPQMIVDCLNRLADALAENNPSLGNMELSLHIDRIDCCSDGRVELRLCKLGALAGIIPTFSDAIPSAPDPVDAAGQGVAQVVPRRRARLRIDAESSPGTDLVALSHFVADPNRFAGLDKRWFETVSFQVPPVLGWAERNADEVHKRWLETGLPKYKLAEEFGVSTPTIRKALKIAEARIAECQRKD